MDNDQVRDEAVKQGWNPDYEGPGKLDAEQFLEKGEQVAGILKKSRDHYKDKSEVLEDRVLALESATREYGEQQRKLRDSLRAENQALLGKLEKQKEKAITDGDGAAYTRANNEIKSVEKKLSQVEPTEAQYNAIVNKWSVANDWYNPQSPDILTTYADGVATRLQALGVTGQYYFDEITRQVKEAFPDKFKNPNRQGANGVESGAGPREESKAKSYKNLPADVQAVCDRLVKSGITTREDYIKNYEW